MTTFRTNGIELDGCGTHSTFIAFLWGSSGAIPLAHRRIQHASKPGEKRATQDPAVREERTRGGADCVNWKTIAFTKCLRVARYRALLAGVNLPEAGSKLVNMSRCRVQVVYSGPVQGVGFRYTVKSITCGFDVTGLVRNLLDGRVELVAEGTRQELEEFLQAIRESGLGSLIRQEEISWLQAKSDMRGFEIAG